MVNSDAISGLFVPTLGSPERETLLALNPRGTRLAVCSQGSDSVQVLDPRSGQEVTRCTGFQRIFGIEFISADTLLVTDCHGCFRCDLPRGKREVLLSQAWPRRTTVSPNGRIVAIGVAGGLVLYDVRRRKVLRRLQASFASSQYGNRAAFSSDGRYVAAELRADDREGPFVVVWDTSKGRRQRIFDPEANALAFREDTLALAIADDHSQVLLYEPDQGEEPAKTLKFEGNGCALQFRDKGRTLAVLLWGGGFVEVKLATGRVTRRIPSPVGRELHVPIASADWSLFAADTEGGVVIWPVDRAETVAAADRGR